MGSAPGACLSAQLVSSTGSETSETEASLRLQNRFDALDVQQARAELPPHLPLISP